MVASARSVGYGSNEEITLLYLVPWPSSAAYRVKTQDILNKKPTRCTLVLKS
jgi:hypothetical protein